MARSSFAWETARRLAYGLGRFDQFGIAELTLFGLALFVGLALISRLWLAFWPQGPAEWVWRRLSYGAARVRNYPLA